MRAAALSPLDALRPSHRPDSGLTSVCARWSSVELAVVRGSASSPWSSPGWRHRSCPLLIALGLLVGGAVAAAFVLEPLGRVIGRPFEWFFGAQGMLGRANLGARPGADRAHRRAR